MTRQALFVAAAFGMLAGSAMAQSGGWLRNGDVAFRIGTSPTFAMPTTGTSTAIPLADFSVNSTPTGTQALGGVDHAFNTWWWFRQPGDNREFAFNSSGAGATSAGFSPTNIATAASTGTMTQFYPNFRADLEYAVQDTGVDAGFLRMTMTLTNLTTAQLSIQTFNTMDIDLGGTAGGDSAALSGPNVMRITDATSPWIGEYSGINANGWAAAPFGASSVSSLMTNAVVNNFTNTGLPFGPGDLTAGFQWGLTIDPGQSVSVVATFSVVPAPSTLALLGLGGLVAVRRRR